MVIAAAVGSALALTGGGVASATTSTEEPSATNEVLDASPIAQNAAGVEAQIAAVSGNTVTVTGEDAEIRVTLPVADQPETAVDSGLLELSEDSSSSIVPVVFDDGSVAIHSVLNDEFAPTTYDYTFDLPAGAAFEIDPDSGAVTAINTDGTPALFVAAPWAKDGNGDAVPTHYTVDGETITQHIQTDGGTAYPVVADPWAGIDLVASFSWTWVSGSGWKINIDPTLWARGYTGNALYVAVGRAGWDELRNKVPSSQRSRLNESGKGQYVCHMGYAGLDAQWNLELWKPAKHDGAWVLSLCN